MSALKNTTEEVAKLFERSHPNQYKIYVLYDTLCIKTHFISCYEIKQDYSVFKTGQGNDVTFET
jgi:hypothetical protein